ncbi:helix-hairpin-helix domain-containing protein [Streptomyces sp. ISL-94]|uniref:helix-hairpin-helix domain-containing protein n=1 Tax=Streptomyces sp. ISL-94 TaxID=2819190 RepID=UPI001BE97230|nr:helix-hairpin-helix domain-containing protein [Streptomyces sp. ISL-94]MBT2482094.1 ATP-binding domain-containing protein [Streptomyces sp. ISL-94]
MTRAAAPEPQAPAAAGDEGPAAQPPTGADPSEPGANAPQPTPDPASAETEAPAAAGDEGPAAQPPMGADPSEPGANAPQPTTDPASAETEAPAAGDHADAAGPEASADGRAGGPGADAEASTGGGAEEVGAQPADGAGGPVHGAAEGSAPQPATTGGGEPGAERPESAAGDDARASTVGEAEGSSAQPAHGSEGPVAGGAEAAVAQPADAAEGPVAGGGEGAGAQPADAGGPGAEPMVSGRGGVGESPAGPTPEAEPQPALSEAAAELAAQKVERERIARRKAERDAPVDAGAKLSGKAADLLAAVRAVESGEKPDRYFDEAPAAPRKAAPTPPPVRKPAPAPEPAAAPAAAAVDSVRAVLARGGAPETLAATAAAALGDGAAEQLAENPWRLLAVPAVRPTQADGFARALLGPEAGPGDERRTTALVGWLLVQAGLKGHTALEAPVLEKALAQYGVPDPAEALEHAIGEGTVLVFHEPLGAPVPEGEEQPVQILVGLEGSAMAEESLADGLARIANTFDSPADWEKAAAQGPGAELIRAVAAHGLVAHTGGEAARAEPLALLAAARELGLRACLAAHAPSASAEAVTVAGLLSGAEGPGRDADGQFALDLLIVLDAPQLDVEIAAALVESVPDGARLVLSGDPGVLGSAGAGRVFADLLAARACPQVVSRVPDPGPIGELVSGIGIGELNQVDAPGKEVVIVPVRDAGEAVHRAVQLVAESVPRAFGIPADSVQVITPGHGGSAGTRALNAALKERLNPGPGRFGGFDPGDRVVHVPSPGRALPARVVSADAEGLHLDRAGARVVVPKELVESQVRHGWAVTAHQAVGVRWPAVVVVLPGDAAQALSRDWVYTAFGRAERHLSVVHGVDQALPQAVAQVLPKPRTTRLAGLLSALAAAAGEQPQ